MNATDDQAGEIRAPRNVVVCCDGTSVNAGANFHHLAGAKIHQFGVAEGCPQTPACGVAL